MTKRELEKKLKKAGFTITHGANHDLWLKDGFPPISVPRHAEDLKKGTVQNILKTAKIK